MHDCIPDHYISMLCYLGLLADISSQRELGPDVNFMAHKCASGQVVKSCKGPKGSLGIFMRIIGVLKQQFKLLF
jgi:hypothetical protein